MLSQNRQPLRRTLAKSVLPGFVQHLNETFRKSFEKRRKRWLSVWILVLITTIFGSLLLVRAKSRRIFYWEQTSSTIKRVKTIPRSRDVVIIEQIRKATRHSWRAYKKCAWSKDIVHPLACEGSEWMGALLTMVDSLDTLWIMKLDAEFDEARKWISSYLEFNSTDPHINVFETTIRLLGGLLSAYTLSKDRMFLGKATILGDILLGAFDGMSAFPSMDINFSTGKGNPNSFEELCLAEVATIQLEFNELSRLTKNPIYAHTAAQVYKRLHELPKMNGLLPIGIDRETGNSVSSRITIGARGDSYYEYLLKVWVQTGKVLDYLRTDYIEAIEGIKSRLIQYSKPNRLLFIGEIDADGTFLPRMDHLACFLPGTLAYGILHNMTRAHLELAESLMRTCYEMYSQTATRLSPENILFDVSNKSTKDFWPASTENILRPETMESLYYLYTITKNPKYQLWGRTILDAFERYSKWHTGGYTGKVDVSTPDSERIDKMESFWLAETLKYAYLLFDEDASSRFPLNKWVFNTEAHPLPVVSDPKSLLSAVYAQLGDV